jgi:fibronectin type 3 domain-containing protein
MNWKRRSAVKRAARSVVEFLEDRRLLSAQISDVTSAHVPSAVAFNTISTGFTGATASRVETVTITDTGNSALIFGSGAFSIVNDPTTTANAANFTIVNSGSLPSSLAPGASATVQLQYSATAVGLQSALLKINSNDPVKPTLTINLHGIGTPGQFGVLEPSLVQVLRAHNIPTIVGAGPNDVNINTQKYPINPDPSSQEVPMQRMVVATPGVPVTITSIASFSTATPAISRIGYYTPGDPTDTTELFHIGKVDAQVVDPTTVGASSFDPGSSPFGLYAVFPGTTTPNGSLDVHYSEDELNVLDPTHARKIRFFPMETPNGTVVPNTFIFATEDYNDPTAFNSFINYVGIISNVKAAPNAALGSTPSSPTGTNPPVMGVQENQTAPGSDTLVFNTIQNPNSIVPDVVHNTNTITINNTGDQPLVINSLTLSDTKNWTIVSPPPPGTAIAGGSSLTVTIKFIATTDPPHSIDETNDIKSDSGVSVQAAGGVWTGTLTVNSNDAVNPTRTVNLAGYWQYQSEHENEPSLTTMSNLMFGYSSDTTGAAAKQGTEYPNNGNTPILYGSEVDPSTDQGLLVAADPSEPVSLIEAAAFHQQYITFTAMDGTTTEGIVSVSESGTTVTVTTQGATAFKTGDTVIIAVGSGVPTATPYTGTFTITSKPTSSTFTYENPMSGLAAYATQTTAAVAGYYPAGGSTKYLYKDQPNNGQSIFPMLAKDSFSTVQTSFTPAGAFGISLDGENSQDSKNPIDLTFNNSSHALRFFPALDANGNVIPNTWIVGLDYRNYLNPNGDYQDLYMILTNATFESLPATPVDLAASQGSGGALLQWAPVSGATGYNVYQVVNGTNVKVNSSPITTTSYLDSTAPGGGVVKYVVTSVNASSVESPGASASVNLAAVNTVPVAPAIQQADGSSGTQVSLTWTASAGATSYNVLREDPGQSSFTTIATGVTATTFADMNVTGGLTYQYEVQAKNANGTSPSSAEMQATVTQLPMAPATPGNFQVSSASVAGVILAWNASAGATSYTIAREDPGTSTFTPIMSGITVTTFTDPNVAAGSTYQYEIEASNGIGTSAFSSPIQANIPLNAPSAPTNLQESTASGTSVALTWDAAVGATSYIVQREEPGASSFVQIAAGLTNTSYTDTAVQAGQSYQYEVLAQNASGTSAPDGPVTAAIPSLNASLDVTVGRGAATFVQFTTDTGTSTTIRLSGAGAATVHFAAATISQGSLGAGVLVTGTHIEISSITTTGTTAGSVLRVQTRGGSNSVNIGGITADAPLNSIQAGTSALIGALAVNGPVNRILLGSASAASLNVGGKLGTLQLGVASGVSLTASGPIQNLIAASWTSNQMITAPSIGSMRIKGDAEIAVTTGTIRSLRVGGKLHDSTLILGTVGKMDMASLVAGSISSTMINAAGNLGTISAATLINSQVYAGGLSPQEAFPPTSSGFPAVATITSVNLKKIKGVFSDVNSSIAASHINHLTLGMVQFNNGGTPFGVEANVVHVLAAVDPTTGKPFTLTGLTSASAVHDVLLKKGIQPGDFAIQII